MTAFDYATADRDEVETLARSFVGKTLLDLNSLTAPMIPSSPRTKGVVGSIYEAAFGIPPNNRLGPDFIGSGVELKSVPIMLSTGEAKAKERISITMIDFVALAAQRWETADVRKKLDNLLLIFYHWEPLQPIARFKTLAAGIWEPDLATQQAIRRDWETIRDLVVSGNVAAISESLTSVLGAATKGPGHGSKSRAWALKQPFVGWLYHSMTGGVERASFASNSNPERSFEKGVLARLEPLIGCRFDELAIRVGGLDDRSKNVSATIVRALVGEKASGRHGDFERFGIEVKVVPVNSRGAIVERMSFPAFVHEELAYETWSDSDLLGRLNRLLIVPIHREKGATLSEMTLGRPFFWSPTSRELEGIAEEWEDVRKLVSAGRSRDLPLGSETRYIHVRTHGRNAQDRDLAPGNVDVAKKSFWLNDGYLREILSDHDASEPPLRR